jgi:hypothetical protein
VFTHLSVELASDWLAELARVVRPGGLAWFTIHGESYRDRLLPEQRQRFDAGEIVVWLPETEGTNICGAYWPPSAVPRMLGDDFEIVEHFDPQADPLTAQRAYLAHDAYLVRRLDSRESGKSGAHAPGADGKRGGQAPGADGQSGVQARGEDGKSGGQAHV